MYYDFFSPSNWLKLSKHEKSDHKKICDHCTTVHAELQALFPSTSTRFSKVRNQNIVHALKTIKMSPRKALQDRTNLVYNIINPHFEKKFGVSFAEGLIANKKLKLSKKPPCDEKKKEKQGIIDS